MKKLLIFISTILVSTSTFGQSEFPEYSEVVKLFFKEYDLKENQVYYDIQFHKKAEGYFIHEEKTNKTQLFWSVKEDKFLRLNFPYKRQFKAYTYDYYFLRKALIQYYSIHKHYGYEGWEKDNIDWFTKQKKLTPDEQESLGRSYSESALNLLNNNMGYAKEKEIFIQSDSGFNLLSKDQLKEYRFQQHKSIEAFKNICLTHPEHQTFIGTACNKYSNEKMSSFLNLMIYQNKTEAMKEINEDTYSDFLIKVGKNHLVNCDSNAILFTNGDNDTYPLLYVQSQGYRTDVSVINLSLLNTFNYLYLIREGDFFGAKPVKFHLSHKDYMTEFKDMYAHIKTNDSIHNKSFDELLDLIKKKDSTTFYKGTQYRAVPSNKISFFKNTEHPIALNLAGERHLYLSSIAALDIIESNPNRPIHFTSGIHKAKTTLFENYLYKEGKIKKFNFKEKRTKVLRVNEKEHLEYLTNSLLVDLKKGSIHEQKNPSFYNLGFQREFKTLSQYYLETKDKEKAKHLADLYKEKAPLKTVYLAPVFTTFVHDLYNLGLTENAEEFIIKYISQFNKELKTDLSIKELEDMEIYANYLKKCTKPENKIFQDLNKVIIKVQKRLP